MEALQVANEEKEMLITYIRFLDYMQCTVLAYQCINNTRSLLGELASKGGARISFETSIRFTENGEIIFHPGQQRIAESIIALANETYKEASKVTRLSDIRLPVLRRKFRTLILDRPNIETIVLNNKPFLKSVDEIVGKIHSNFEEAKDYSRSFKKIRPIFDYINTFDFELYKKTADDLSTVKSGIRKTREMENMLTHKMRITNRIGMMVVESRELKNTLMPRITSIMDDMKQLLKKMANDQCLSITKVFQVEFSKLEVRPHHLDKFADAVRSHNESTKNLQDNLQQSTAVDEMIRLLNQLEVKIDSRMMVEVDQMHDAQQVRIYIYIHILPLQSQYLIRNLSLSIYIYTNSFQSQ